MICQRIEEPSQVGEVRRLAASMGWMLGFDRVRAEHVSIVVTELSTNLLKHAGGGEIILRALQTADTTGLEMLSLDKGPGIKHVGNSLCDGYSTSGSLGTGLGAIRRLSSLLDLYSTPGRGTAVLSHLWRQPPPAAPPPTPLEIGVVCLPVKSERACGDAWAVHQSRERSLAVLFDGLGHGEHAAEVSAEALKVFESHSPNSSPAELLRCMHNALRGTRGGVVGIAEMLPGQRVVRYIGMGNIAGRIVSGKSTRNLVSHNGIVGMETPAVQELTFDWPENGLLILHSDGLDTHWDLDDYPGLPSRHPALIAGVLSRDHRRIGDDNTVLVLREKKGEGHEQRNHPT